MSAYRDTYLDMLEVGTITNSTLDATFWKSTIEKQPPFQDEIVAFFDSEFQVAYWWGDYGTGKTYGARCVLNEAMRRGRRVVDLTAVDLVRGMRLFKGHPLIGILKRCTGPILIDDLLQADWDSLAITGLWEILNERNDRGGKTIVTANIPPQGFMEVLAKGSNASRAGSIIDRLQPGLVLHFEGESLR